MNKEQLLAAGFTEAQADSILKMHKESIDGNYVAKHRFDEVNTELKTAKDQVSERDQQITDLKKFEGDAKALQEKITALEADNAKKDSEYAGTLATERKRNAVKLALLEDENGKPFDTDMVMGLFNLEQVTIDEATGKVTAGFKEQAEGIRKEKAFLFSTPEAKPGTPGWKPAGKTPEDGKPGGAGAADVSETYGKSLAQVKLGMMGVKPAGTTEQ